MCPATRWTPSASRTRWPTRSLLESKPAEAAELLGEALALWRGHPYADVPGSVRLEAEARRLEQLRLGAVEDRVEAELALGRHAELLPELEVLTDEFPLSERFRGQQMVALYRAGRQTEALRAYQKTRLFLAEEMGIDPSTELQGLEQRILDHDPGLEAESASRVQTMSFLMTDIVDSTLLWELHPAEMPEVLARHDRLLTEAVEQAGGRVFNQAGDGVCAAFATVGEAVTAARSAQEALAAADWGETGLSVRMAVDTGEVESRGSRLLRSAVEPLLPDHGGGSRRSGAALRGSEFGPGRRRVGWFSGAVVGGAPLQGVGPPRARLPAGRRGTARQLRASPHRSAAGLTARWRPLGAGL